MPEKSIETLYNSYALRVWREKSTGEWRASLRDVRDGKQLNFTSVEQLMAFIADQSEQLSK